MLLFKVTTMESQDQELFVVIVENDDEDVQNDTDYPEFENVEIKEEVLENESDAEMPVEHLIEQATLYGEWIDIDDSEPFIKIEGEEFMDDDEKKSELIETLLGRHDDKNEEKQRHKMLKPWQRKSNIQKLKKEHPEAAKDPKLLIQIIVDEMRKIKAPIPPDGYYNIDLENGFFNCSMCSSSNETEPAASRHYQEKHGPRYLNCFACGANFRSKTNLYKHEKYCIAPDAVVMLKARALFLGNKGRHRPFLPKKNYVKKNHLKYKYSSSTKRIPVDKERPKTFICELCSAVFKSRTSLNSHHNLHRGERPYVCELCHNAYTSPAALSRHRRRHGAAKFTCDHCQRSFKLKETLVVHMDIHLPEPRFACSECPRRYSQRAALVLHVARDHRRLPPAHACHVCHQRFPRLTNLKSHMKKIHGMLIITRKMFFKQLPKVKDIILQQAKVVYKSQDDSLSKSTEPQEPVNIDSPEEMLKLLTAPQNDDVSYVTLRKGDVFCLNRSDEVEGVLSI